MAATTKIVYLKTKAGVALVDSSVDKESPLARFNAAVKTLPEVKELSWGQTEEKDAQYDFVIVCEWAGEGRADLPLALLNDILDDSLTPIQFEVRFQPLPFSAAVFPPGKPSSSVSPYICELVALSYPAGSDKPDLTNKLNDLLSNLTKLHEVPAAYSYTTGFVVEPMQSPAGEPIDVTYSVVQWDSVKAHMDAKGTETFGKYIAPLRENLVALPWQMRHVRFNRVL